MPSQDDLPESQKEKTDMQRHIDRSVGVESEQREAIRQTRDLRGQVDAVLGVEPDFVDPPSERKRAV